ncbi:MAG: NADH-quinone oxidoreductase subunit [Actinomycetota bacterium]|jgi:NADH-quinone oxidoreductase E subunit
MARFSANNLVTAQAIIARYPKPRSALVPLCHLAQEQDGYLTDDAMEHIGELIGCTPAQVYGTATFYEMFKLHPTGKYLVGVCTNISCMLSGAYELLEHCERSLGVSVGGTSADGMFTLEEVECSAACTVAPAVQVNYRYEENVTPESFDALVSQLRAGTRDDIPPHGTLARVRQTPTDRWANSGQTGEHIA